MRQLERDQVNAELAELLPSGLVVERAERGIGSFMTIDFQSTSSAFATHLWVYFSNWWLFEGDELILSDYSEPAMKDQLLQKLRSRVLEQARLAENDDPDVIEFAFERDLTLQLTPYSGDADGDEEAFMVFRAGKHAGSFSHRTMSICRDS